MKQCLNMTTGVSIVHFVIKVPKFIQMIVIILYRVQAYQVPIVNPRWPPEIQDGCLEIHFLTFPQQTAVIFRASSRSSCFP